MGTRSSNFETFPERVKDPFSNSSCSATTALTGHTNFRTASFKAAASPPSSASAGAIQNSKAVDGVLPPDGVPAPAVKPRTSPDPAGLRKRSVTSAARPGHDTVATMPSACGPGNPVSVIDTSSV
eukprot:12879606-Alexandrium_andersonii.AAC.1